MQDQMEKEHRDGAEIALELAFRVKKSVAGSGGRIALIIYVQLPSVPDPPKS